MGTPPRPLAAFKIPVRCRGTAVTGFQPVCIHGQAHGTAWLAPFETGLFKDDIQTFLLGGTFDQP